MTLDLGIAPLKPEELAKEAERCSARKQDFRYVVRETYLAARHTSLRELNHVENRLFGLTCHSPASEVTRIMLSPSGCECKRSIATSDVSSKFNVKQSDTKNTDRVRDARP